MTTSASGGTFRALMANPPDERLTDDASSDDDNALVFADEAETSSEPSPSDSTAMPPWKVLVVDDDEGLHAITRMVLAGARYAGRPIDIRSAYSGRVALAALAAEPDTALVLLDVVMESDDAGLIVAQDLREKLGNQDTRVVLRTGQPGLAPPRDIVLRYAIDGYESKAELTAQKLFTVVIAALRSYERACDRARALEAANIALAAQAASLEAEVAARTASLTDALATARDALAAKETFLAVVSHELRTPLHGVLGAASLLAGSRLEPAQRRYIDVITSSGRLLGALIDDVLDLATMSREGLRLNPAPHALRPLVDAAVQIVSARAIAKGLALAVTVAPEVPELAHLDATRFQQVLVNLLGNAVKFTEHGHITLDVATLTEGEAHALCVSVADTGIGIAPEATAKLFEPFVQADATTRATYGGSGLGLAICKRIVTAMGGTITLESRLAEGTRVSFRIPLTSAQALEIKRIAAANSAPFESQRVHRQTLTPAPPSGPPGVSGRTALVVDDNSINAMLLRTLLERYGLVVEEAYDGDDALAQAGARHFDFIFMDMEMPRMDGPTATRRLREACTARGAPQPFVVAVTANARAVDRQRCVDAGMNAFLSKPFTDEELRTALAEGLAATAGT
jgi:signal transduction histidine kinase